MRTTQRKFQIQTDPNSTNFNKRKAGL